MNRTSDQFPPQLPPDFEPAQKRRDGPRPLGDDRRDDEYPAEARGANTITELTAS